MKKTIKKVIEKSGFQIQRSQSNSTEEPGPTLAGYDLEEEANQQIQIVAQNTMGSHQRLVTLYQQAVFCEQNGIAGDYVECGTWRGGCVGLMALANLQYGKQRRQIHLFDSFESIPEPDAAVDGERAVTESKQAGGGASGQLVPVAFYDEIGNPDLEANKHLLEKVIGYDSQHLHYHKGWFQETLPTDAAQVGPIAILRLDGDWYASTKVCLEYLFDKVVAGGFVIIDDYGCYEGCKKAVDEFLKQKGLRVFLNHIDLEGRYWINP